MSKGDAPFLWRGGFIRGFCRRSISVEFPVPEQPLDVVPKSELASRAISRLSPNTTLRRMRSRVGLIQFALVGMDDLTLAFALGMVSELDPSFPDDLLQKRKLLIDGVCASIPPFE
jgi:hypothetical protein